MQQTAADAVTQLVESKAIAKQYQMQLSKLDKEGYKDQIKASKDIQKSIDSLVNKFLGTPDDRQGITRNPEVTVMQRLGLARNYVNNSQTGITSTETTLIKHAKDEMGEVLSQVNSFFREDWVNYQNTMKAVKLNPFKKVEIYSLD